MVCLLDLDLRAPSIYSIFKNNAPHWVNDYLSKACKIETVLSDCTSKDMDEGKRALREENRNHNKQNPLRVFFCRKPE
jgi:hypothetical protein